MTEQQAQSDNLWELMLTELKDLSRRVSIVEDLKEETEVTPEKFVTEESFDQRWEKERQINRVRWENESNGRQALEMSLLKLEERNNDMDALKQSVERMEQEQNVIRSNCAKWLNKTKQLSKEMTACQQMETQDAPSTLSESSDNVSLTTHNKASIPYISAATLEDLSEEFCKKLKTYENQLSQIQATVNGAVGVHKPDAPPTSVSSAKPLSEANPKDFVKCCNEQLPNELHHQVVTAQGSAYRIHKLKREVAVLAGNPRERAPMSIDIDRTSVMWDLPQDTRKLTSVGDSYDRLHLQALLSNIFHRLNSLELNLVQLSEQRLQIEDLERNMQGHVSDDMQHHKARPCSCVSSLQTVSRLSAKDDNDVASAMSLESDEE